jgi:peptide subunit release factor RF-3
LRRYREPSSDVNVATIAQDIDGDVVFLVRNTFDLDYTGRENTDIFFSDVKDIYRRSNTG